MNVYFRYILQMINIMYDNKYLTNLMKTFNIIIYFSKNNFNSN